MNPYETDLDQNAANYVPLTPLSFLPRSAATFPDRVAVVHGDRRYTWAEVYERCVPAGVGALRASASGAATRSR